MIPFLLPSPLFLLFCPTSHGYLTYLLNGLNYSGWTSDVTRVPYICLHGFPSRAHAACCPIQGTIILGEATPRSCFRLPTTRRIQMKGKGVRACSCWNMLQVKASFWIINIYTSSFIHLTSLPLLWCSLLSCPFFMLFWWSRVFYISFLTHMHCLYSHASVNCSPNPPFSSVFSFPFFVLSEI